MRTFIIISLATAVACQETETEIGTADNSSTEGSVAEGNQEETTEGQDQDWQLRDDFAGGTVDTPESLYFYDQISEGEEGEEEGTSEWGSAPMAEGIYLGTVEMVLDSVCGDMEPGMTWETRLQVAENGNSLLGGGLLESNGDQLRFNRIRESEVPGSMDCVEVEHIEAVGTMFGATEMDFELETSVFMEGSDCPVMTPCTDRYMAYLELNSPAQ